MAEQVKDKSGLTVSVGVDTTELDGAISKVKELNLRLEVAEQTLLRIIELQKQAEVE